MTEFMRVVLLKIVASGSSLWKWRQTHRNCNGSRHCIVVSYIV